MKAARRTNTVLLAGQRVDPACGKRELSPARQGGVSLVEVLVASVVLSIGLLGLAGLQASGLRVGQSSILRTQAAQLAYDMADRIRANTANANDYRIGLAETTPSCQAVPSCDLRDWRLRLQGLPAGTGSVDVGALPRVTIIVRWDDARGGGVLRDTEADEAARARLATSEFALTVRLAD